MKAPFPSYVENWRNDTYPSIDPTRPELSHAGKTIVVTGASTGIGKAVALAYAAAGASKIAILARREPLLKQVKSDIEAKFPKTQVSFYVADVTDRTALATAAKAIGTWHVLVLNAGFMSTMAPAASADADDWWKGYEVNVLGTLLSIQAFFATKVAHAAIVGISSGVVALPGAMMANGTGYQSSKLAVARFLETFAAENPDLYIGILHPGVIDTDMFKKSGLELPIDNESLPAHYIVWSTSPEGAFTSGKMIYANWDVDELKGKQDEIKNTPVLSASLLGWPWATASA